MRKDIHPVDERLPLGQTFLYGLQHVLAMYAGAVAVPLILANALGLDTKQLIYLINADLFTCGIATLIQTMGPCKIGSKLPIIQGVTFAAVTPMIMIGKNGGLTDIYGAVIAAGLVVFLIAPYFSRLIRFFPPVVTGSVITIIGISLLPVAVRWAGGGNPAAKDFGDVSSLLLALLVLAIVILFYRCFTGFLRNISVLLGLIVGTIIAAALGETNFSAIGNAAWVGVTTPFSFGFPTFNVSAVAAMILVMLVVMTETTGDFIAVGEIVDKEIDKETLTRGLRADGFSTFLGGIFNAFPYTAFAQNIGLISLTNVKSRFVVAASGCILVALGLFPKLAALIASIPAPVLGGAGLAMFGMVAANGIKTLSKVDFNGNYNVLVVGISLAMGLIPTAMPNFYSHLTGALQVIFDSGITVGSLTAIILNAILNNNAVTEKKADVNGQPLPTK
ncbi:nucleobase:cation symporter-2 family protein [Pectinatus brassicae]|uniref:NCS2 family nucleobase:cation symporter-2 n=1 Tax=Pectinatus brassicae TaxID=862415 RepID=A0A840UHD5_9FIRM|nr:nucleobase:cation symporter-2 family protein [Pectinatus brassicae]MBB5335600.1 NCS2 family nucleobase:cation symporter-2 [Pectinatus brassicae]